MEVNSIAEMPDLDGLIRQLHLLLSIQAENLTGSWEYRPGDDQAFWSDSMFMLHGLAPSHGNLIHIEEAEKFIYKDDVAYVQEKRNEALLSGSADYYFRIITSKGDIKRVRAYENVALQDGLAVLRGTIQDERGEREAQRSLRENSERLSNQLKVFERAEEVAQTGSWQINLETYETIYSDNVYRIYGIAPQSIPSHVDTFRKFIHPDDRSVVLKTLEKAYVEQIPVHLEYRIVREDGEIRYISQVSHLLRSEKGDQILAGNTRDTTDQKVLELQLLESNELLSLYNELFTQAEQIGKLGTWQLNLDTRKRIYSDNVYRIFGLKPQLVGTSFDSYFFPYIHPEDRQWVTDMHVGMFENPEPFDVEIRIIRADGKPRIIRSKGRPVKNPAGESLMIGVLQDITHHKEKDLQLKKINETLILQHELFKQAESIASMGSWTWNLSTQEAYFSDSMYGIYGLKPQSIKPTYENFEKYIHPEDRELMKEMIKQINSAFQPITFEYRIVRPDGELRHLRSRNQPFTLPDGQTIIIGTSQDITEEISRKQQLLDKVQFAETLADSILDRVAVTDRANNIIGWNKSCERIYKMTKEEVLGRNFFDVFPKVKTSFVIDNFKRALSGETIHIPSQQSPMVPGYQEVMMVPFRSDQGKVIGVVMVLHDITAQQQLQEQLSARLHLFEKLQEVSADRVIVLDYDLHFQFWNAQCEKYYGLSKEKVLGKNLHEVFPRFKKDPLSKYCQRTLEGETFSVTSASGAEESYFTPLKNEADEVTGLLWVTHDKAEEQVTINTALQA